MFLLQMESAEGHRIAVSFRFGEEMEMVEYLLTPMAQVGMIMAIAEVLKRSGFKKKYIPVVDLILGLISGIFVSGIMLGYGIGKGIIIGIALGLTACGTFSGVKNVTEASNDRE